MVQGSPFTASARLLAGVAALALMTGVAWAAEPVAPDAPVKTCQAGCNPNAPVRTPAQVDAIEAADVLGENGFYLESNELIDDGENERFIARGEVEARYQGKVVRADEVEYRSRTGLVIARGNARVLNPDGTLQAADEITLDEDFAAGVAVGFSTQLDQGIKIVAASAVRRNAQVTDLNRALYTPCPICTPDGTPKQPTFAIQAERVTQDRERRIIYYRNAVIRVKNVPVFYAPVFFHPDPSAKRATGFLVPDAGLSDKRGFTLELPYYVALSPSQDVTITPQLNTKVNPFLLLDYRKRFYSGTLNARFGYTYEEDFDSDGDKESDPEFDGRLRTVNGQDVFLPYTGDGATNRSFVLADGRFQLTPNWSYGFTAERTSDDLLFDKYDIGDVYGDRGLFLADDRRLLSQLYTIRSGPRSYVSVSALSFQGLRFGDDDAAFPTVAPLVEARYEPEQAIAGGRLRVRASGVALFRDGPVAGLPVPPGSVYVPEFQRVEGLDSSRVTLEADWRRPITFANGLRVEPLAELRADAYRVGDRPPALLTVQNPVLPFIPFDNTTRFGESFTRYNATLGAEVSYPLLKVTERGSILLEPVAQVLISPEADDSLAAPNEDSQVLSLDETNLFDTNRFAGFDRYEGGQRVNLGGRASFDWGAGREATVFLGRSFRRERDLQYSTSSGLREKGSDYVVAATATPLPGVSFGGRARLDGDTGEIRRAEASAATYGQVFSAAAFYYFADRDETNAFSRPIHELSVNGEYRFRKNWGAIGSAVRDLEADITRRTVIGGFYQDECVRLDIFYEREQTFRGTGFGPSSQIGFRLSLATLGGTGSDAYQ